MEKCPVCGQRLIDDCIYMDDGEVQYYAFLCMTEDCPIDRKEIIGGRVIYTNFRVEEYTPAQLTILRQQYEASHLKGGHVNG